ncbi:hypothetical protein F0562_011604 [Nyssa sinensis]|uniref:Uncharacterized protein n=1 Tax=Nyssa sinensis TaxID=561372 RepID=A0A5J4ZUY3_9ASTE|nr:hypothetical protein F0562_011604 [Nyssa sinensis]
MEEGSKVPVVRCPKCEILLPELPNYSIYRCGGCGAVLRAKKKGPVSYGLSEKSDDERGRGGSVKGGGVSLRSASENESDGLERVRIKERGFSERTVNLISSCSSIIENRDPASDLDRNMSRETMNLSLARSNEDREVEYYDDRSKQSSKRSYCNRVHRNNHDMNRNVKRSEFVNSSVENQLEEIRPAIGNLARSFRSRPIMDKRSVERNGSMAFHGGGRGVEEQGRFSTFPYPDEGPSNYHPAFCPGYSEQNRIHDELDGPSRIENLEHDRAELLRKLEELKDQFRRSCDVAEKPIEKVPVDRTMAPPPPNPCVGHDVYMPNCPTSLYSVNMQPFAYDKFVPKPPHFNHSHGPVPYINSQASDMQEFYPLPRKVPNEFIGYEDFYPPPMLRRPPHQPPRQHLKQPYHYPFSGQDMDFNQGTLASHPYETFFHQSECSCLHCYNQNWQVPPKVPAPVFSSSSPNDPTNPIFCHHASPVTFGPVGYNSGDHPPQLHAQNQKHPQTTSSSNHHSNTAGFGHGHPKRVVIAYGNGRFCHPIAGGAPFITCCNCFELLKLPRKRMVMGENQQKLKCGACSTIILFELGRKGLVILISKQINQDSVKVDDGSGEKLNENLQQINQDSVKVDDGSGEKLNENLHRSDGCSNAGTMNCYSVDFDNSGYNFQLTDAEPNILTRDQKLDFSESSKRQDPLSSCSSFSEDEQNPDSVIVQRDVTDSAVLPSKDDVSLPLPDNPLLEKPVCSPSNSGVSRYGKGNKSKRNDQEKVILDRSTSRQNSVKDVSMATEMEVSFNEYLSSGVSQDSMEVSKEGDQPRINKGSESFFVGLIKKRFRDFSRPSQSAEAGQANVFVNRQPIPDNVVKKAEKLAGPIQPGEYWYDFRGGFWGVMGQPCLGIIPPFIEEFHYPMPKNCAAGNSSVFVNGRELHQRDLDLLAGRGLPTTRDKSYIVEFSGKVLDVDTGEELHSLGKLAPTICAGSTLVTGTIWEASELEVDLVG